MEKLVVVLEGRSPEDTIPREQVGYFGYHNSFFLFTGSLSPHDGKCGV